MLRKAVAPEQLNTAGSTPLPPEVEAPPDPTRGSSVLLPAHTCSNWSMSPRLSTWG